jgi:hypothetical protein
MTEAEWLSCRAPGQMAAHVWSRRPGRPGNARRLRLLGCACVRALGPLVRQPGSREALEVAERFADNQATRDELWAARLVAMKSLNAEGQAAHTPYLLAAKAAEQLTIKNYNGGTHPSFAHAIRSAADAWAFERILVDMGRNQGIEFQVRQAEHADWLRDIFGNPFRPVAFSPAWRTDTAVALARQMYDARDFGAMPILADALQEAGCDSEDMLNHCRDPKQVHVRGCWVVDMVLGKE